MKPWKSPDCSCSASDSPSFNGATAMKPWKRYTLCIRPYRTAGKLQWGHGDEAVEEGPPPGPFGAEDLVTIREPAEHRLQKGACSEQ